MTVSSAFRLSGVIAAAAVLAATVLTGPAANADVALPVRGSLTVTVPGTSTPITVTPGQPSPAMTYTASGIGLSGFPNSTRFASEIQVRPGGSTGSVMWQAGGWSPNPNCPTNAGSPTTTLSDCGILGVYIDDVQLTDLRVYVSYDAAAIASNPAATGIHNTLIIRTVSGAMINTVDTVGTVRVELAEGAWLLSDTAVTPSSWSMWVRDNVGSKQGDADTYTKTVTFDPNGGTGPRYSQTQTSNASVALRDNLFSNGDYSFAGWNTQADGEGTSYTNGASFTFSASTTLFAQWRLVVNRTVSFNANGGEGTMADQVADTATALPSNLFTRPGYVFGGWATSEADADAGTVAYADGADFDFASDLTLFAVWVAEVPDGVDPGSGDSDGANDSATGCEKPQPYVITGDERLLSFAADGAPRLTQDAATASCATDATTSGGATTHLSTTGFAPTPVGFGAAIAAAGAILLALGLRRRRASHTNLQ